MLKSSYLLLFFLCCFTTLYAQVTLTLALNAPTIAAGGEPFGVTASVNYSGTLSGPQYVPKCLLTSTTPFLATADSLYAAGCTPIPTVAPAITSWTCNMTGFNNSALQQGFTAFSGNLIATDACIGQRINITWDCEFANSQSLRIVSIAASSANLAVNLTDNAPIGDIFNLTDVGIIDFTNTSYYEIRVAIRNTGICDAINVDCTLTLPEVVNPANQSQGVVAILPNETTVSESQFCSLAGSTISCKIPDFAVAGIESFIIAFRLVNNGNLSSSIMCSADRLIDPASASANLNVIGVGVPPPPPPSPPVSESSESDLIINTVIPLAIFGGVMLILLTIIIVTTVLYLLLKKARGNESVGF